MLSRERRSWTAKEDQLLREAVAKEDPNTQNPSKWHAIAKHVPDRTNKDCRKRWFAKMASDVVKGGWAPDEDERLVKAIERYGTRWSMVASLVGTRNSDQCAKRWTDTLNPSIDRTSWTPESDAMLISAVNEHGKLWTKIVKTYFPGRTGLSAKNRYNSITRFNSDRTRRPSKSTSSTSSSASVSPITPSMSIPDGPFSHTSSHHKSDVSFDMHTWGSLSSPYPSPAYSSSTFPEDALLAFPPQSPYDSNISSPFSSASESGYEYPQPTLPQSSFDLAGPADQHWATTNQVYEPQHWERYRQPSQQVGYMY
ncbi:hypothetical protein BDZ89DRAFT_993743 [Hymenopellis radicata]|nr:hypothetical protein BDZ89DRAFT_993743 [Hymenopellis radicata]